MITNKYYIVPVAEVTQQMKDDTIGDFAASRRSIDTTLCVLKGPESGASVASLSGYTEYTHAGILVEMAKAAWATDPT